MLSMKVWQGFTGQWYVKDYSNGMNYPCTSLDEALLLWVFWVMP